MIKKILNTFRKKKQNSINIKAVQSLSASFAILDEFARRGILHFHRQPSSAGALLIEEALATLKLAEGERGFKHFLEQVAQWQNYRLLQEAYEAHRIDTEAKAVREAKRTVAELGSGTPLTKADIQRIRQNARENMSEIDSATVLGDNPSEFDLFIIRATAPSSAQATEANGQLLALGHWDGKTLEMAMYDDIKHNLQREE